MKLFVSYARVDKPLCKQIVERLQDVHDVWYDRRLHAGQQWWDEIVRRLDWCEGFVYLLSPESVASEYCQREFAIAQEAGKHIFPVLIQARTDVPASLNHIQYADLSQGMEDVITLMNALTVAERQQRVPKAASTATVKAAKETAPGDVSPNMALTQAADAMEDENFDGAVFILKRALEKKPSGRIKRILEQMLKDAETALEKQAYLRDANREYAPIVDLVKRASTRNLGCQEFADFQRQYPDYDPENVSSICAKEKQKSLQSDLLRLVEKRLVYLSSAVQTPPEKQVKTKVLQPETPVQAPAKPARRSSPAKPGSLELMPAPFAWIEIPGGHGSLETDETEVTLSIPIERYWIAKYPVTNAQFTRFIEAGGYRERKWWTEAGWKQPEKSHWTEPRFWNNRKWNGAEQPVVGVSWYEAVAFCLWLSDVTGEKIMLPAEAQWQYAAQGDDGRAYPWGNDWDCKRCNTSVEPCKSTGTTPVTQYEGKHKGDSPFGVVDMAGNVWEWCLTDYNNQTNDVNIGAERRVLRGGSWNNLNSAGFRCAFRNWYAPNDGHYLRGFRLARS
ncbi:MAG: SUMF1/EgtB/PvdO family nonheme iron enzyme [Anaerolineae bacterium]|nr:SUMF1/EgtB/PvdO family nonheme iron enzyme [Anaerolineae bacterium]